MKYAWHVLCIVTLQPCDYSITSASNACPNDSERPWDL